MVETTRAWSKHIPPGPWDYVIVGSGMGGMTTAALLSKIGRRVLVLEQHYVPGGFTHAFRRPGYEWDVGVHAVGEVTHHSMPGRLLAALTDGQLRWASLGPVYDEFHFPGDFRIDFPDTPAQFRANLIDAFPEQEHAIDGWLRKVREVAQGMKGYYLGRTLPPHRIAALGERLLGRQAQAWLQTRTSDVLAQLTDDPKLRAVLVSQWGYYGSTPSRSSFAIQALVTKHFLHGAYYPVGGAKQIARTMLSGVAKSGGWTAIRTDVDEIVVEHGKAVGVRLTDGQEIRAHRVVSAAGIGATTRRLLPHRLQDATWAQEVRRLPPAPAHVVLYLGFEGDIRQAGCTAANKWFYQTWDTEMDAWRVGADAPPPSAPVLYCSFPSLKDPEHDPGPQLRHTGEVVTFVPWEAFAPWQDARWHKRGEDYETFKQRLTESLTEQFLAHMPGLRPMLRHVELGTPVSTQHFVRPVHGSIYGLEPTPERFATRWLRPRSPIQDLFFSGSDVGTVGVIGAMMGGVLAAISAEPVGMMGYLRRVT